MLLRLCDIGALSQRGGNQSKSLYLPVLSGRIVEKLCGQTGKIDIRFLHCDGFLAPFLLPAGIRVRLPALLCMDKPVLTFGYREQMGQLCQCRIIFPRPIF